MSKNNKKNTKNETIKTVIAYIGILIILSLFIIIISRAFRHKATDAPVSQESASQADIASETGEDVDENGVKEENLFKRPDELEDGDKSYGMYSNDTYTVDKFAEYFVNHELVPSYMADEEHPAFSEISSDIKEESDIIGIWTPYGAKEEEKDLSQGYDIFSRDAAYLDIKPAVMALSSDGSYIIASMNFQMHTYKINSTGKWSLSKDTLTFASDGKGSKDAILSNNGIEIRNNGVTVYLTKNTDRRLADFLYEVGANENLSIEAASDPISFVKAKCDINITSPAMSVSSDNIYEGTWETYAIIDGSDVEIIDTAAMTGPDREENKDIAHSDIAYQVIFSADSLTKLSLDGSKFYGTGSFSENDHIISYSYDEFDPETYEQHTVNEKLYLKDGCIIDKDTLPGKEIYLHRMYQMDNFTKDDVAR